MALYNNKSFVNKKQNKISGIEMPPWTVIEIGSQQTNNATSVVVTASSSVNSGGIAICIWCANSSPGTLSITDNTSNGPLIYDTTNQQTGTDSSNGNFSRIVFAKITKPIISGTTTITISGISTVDTYVKIYALNNFTSYDTGSSSNEASSTSHTTGISGTIKGPQDMAISMMSNFGETYTSTWGANTLAADLIMSSRHCQIMWKPVFVEKTASTATTSGSITSANALALAI